jgi:hypothetical protein
MRRTFALAFLLIIELTVWSQTRKVGESWTLTEHNYETNRCMFIWFASGAATLRVTTICAAHTTLNVGDVVEPIVGVMHTHHGWDVYVESHDAVFVNIDTKARETFRFVKQEVVR